MNELNSRANAAHAWLEKARHDLICGKAALALVEDCPYDMVCFHAHQCTEKAIKALMVLHGIIPPRNHDLTELIILLPELIKLPATQDDLAALNPFAVEQRYPGADDNPSPEETQRAMEIATLVLTSALSILKAIKI